MQAKQLITLSDQTIIGILKETAQVLRTHTEEVLAANRQDLERMDPANPKYDRLKLTEERLQGIAADMENVSTLPSPLNKVLSETIRPNGMVIRKVTVPFGVIGVTMRLVRMLPSMFFPYVSEAVMFAY